MRRKSIKSYTKGMGINAAAKKPSKLLAQGTVILWYTILDVFRFVLCVFYRAQILTWSCYKEEMQRRICFVKMSCQINLSEYSALNGNKSCEGRLTLAAIAEAAYIWKVSTK